MLLRNASSPPPFPSSTASSSSKTPTSPSLARPLPLPLHHPLQLSLTPTAPPHLNDHATFRLFDESSSPPYPRAPDALSLLRTLAFRAVLSPQPDDVALGRVVALVLAHCEASDAEERDGPETAEEKEARRRRVLRQVAALLSVEQGALEAAVQRAEAELAAPKEEDARSSEEEKEELDLLREAVRYLLYEGEFKVDKEEEEAARRRRAKARGKKKRQEKKRKAATSGAGAS